MRSWDGVAFLCVILLTLGCQVFMQPIDASMHRVVREVTYGTDREVPAVDHEFYLYALLKPTLVRKYLNCSRAVSLIGATPWHELIELGNKLNGMPNQAMWAKGMQDWSGFPESNKDPMIPLALGEAAGQAASYLRELGLESAEDASAALSSSGSTASSLRAKVQASGQAALRVILRDACSGAPKYSGPTLALSGGSANGAFTAGFVYQLLFARELTFQKLGTLSEKESFLASSRFSAVVGTSVGSLIGQVLDLYAVEDFGDVQQKFDVKSQFKADKSALADVHYEPGDPPPTQPTLEALLRHLPSTDAELARQWTLVKLLGHFTDIAEREAICVQPGPATRLIGYPGSHVPGLMRFDPLQHEILDPLLEKAGPAMIQNGFPRVAVSVEVSQNVTVGLDDMACRGAASPSECLAAGVMAATVLPFFAQPVNRVRTGLSPDEDCGVWLDGGLRSGFPVERALLLSRPDERGERLRTLAVSTSRATGLPSRKSDDTILDIAKEAIGEMGNQVQVSEVLSSSRFAMIEQERWEELSALLGAGLATESASESDAEATRRSSKASGRPLVVQQQVPVGQTGQQSALDNNPYLDVVFVPRKVPDYFVAGAGYRFDPLVMRGLFVSGQLEAVERANRITSNSNTGLIERLGWSESMRVREALRESEPLLRQWLQRVHATWHSKASERHKAGKARFEHEVKTCADAPTAGEPPLPVEADSPPPYFGGDSKTCRILGVP